MSDAPTLLEELERKATETLAGALRSLSLGHTTPEATSASLGALWGAVSGLVSEELNAMIADARDAVDEEDLSPPRCHVLAKGSSIALLTLPETRLLTCEVITITSGRIKRIFAPEDNTLDELTRWVERARDRLIKHGYEDITYE